MRSNTIRILVLIGSLTVIGLASVQFYLLRAALNNRKEVFDHSVQIALFKVVNRLNDLDVDQLPQVSPVIKKSNDYYIVDVNRDFNCEILEFFLISEFERAGIYYDFEYAIYDCYSDAMIYGNFVTLKNGHYKKVEPAEFYKHQDLVYYFAVYFPHIKSDILGSIKAWIVFAIVLFFVLVFIIYAIWVILEQKRFSELQRNFVDTMTHEFSTPLSASSIAIEYFLHSDIIKKDRRLKKYADLINLQNNRLNVLIDKLLHTTKTGGSGLKVKYEKIRLYDLCKDVVSVFKSGNDRVRFNLFFQDEMLEICADYFHTTNILHAIIDNAVKYSEPSPDISIYCKKEKKVYLLSIVDNGIGIAHKYKKKVFKQFFRVPTGNIHNVKGFGIGLYYVKLLTKKMRWGIEIDKKAVKGTVVHLRVPSNIKRCK